jgi:hypothetical protein
MMAIKPDDVKRVILDEDDFGFELQVGQVLVKLGQQRQKDAFNGTNVELLRHGGTYTDPATNKPRQFDYRCRVYRREPGSSFMACAFLAIECKNLHESSPLAVCGKTRSQDEAYFAFVRSICDDANNKVSSVLRRPSRTKDIFYSDGFVGKSLVRLKEKEEREKKEKGGTKVEKKTLLTTDNSQNSDLFDRWSQALASCSELAEEACFLAHENCMRVCSMILPIVVVPDNSLWKVKYNEAGSIEEEPTIVNECEFFVERKIQITAGKFAITHIHFVTLTGLAELVSRFWSHQEVWTWLFPAYAERYI